MRPLRITIRSTIIFMVHTVIRIIPRSPAHLSTRITNTITATVITIVSGMCRAAAIEWAACAWGQRAVRDGNICH